MTPSDRDPAAPPPEPEDAGTDWATEESVVEPHGPEAADGAPTSVARTDATGGPPSPADAAHDVPASPPARPTFAATIIGDTPPPRPPRPIAPDQAAAESIAPASASPATLRPAPPPAPPSVPPASAPAAAQQDPAAAGSWLASAHGLVPSDPAAIRAGTPANAPEPDYGATAVFPHPVLPADDWGWHPADTDPATDQPASPVVPMVAPRSASSGAGPTGSPYAWMPYDPEAAQPAVGGSPVASAAPGPYAAAVDDPYGRQALVGRGVAVQPSGSPVFDPADYWAETAPRRRRGMPWRRLVVSFVFGLLLTGFVAGGAIYAYEQQYQDRILPNVHVGSVDVSGLTRDQAHDRLTQAYAGYGQGTIDVTLAGATTQISYADIDRHADVDAMVDAAFGVGRAPATIDRLLGELRTVTKGATIQPAVVVDAAKLEQRVHDIAQAAESQPVDAGAVVTPDGFATTPSKAGQTVDEGTAAADIAKQLASVDAPQTETIALTATAVPPNVSDASAQVAATQAGLMQNDVVLQDGTDTWTIPAATVHQWLSFTVINNRMRIAIDTKGVLAQVTPLAKTINQPAINATVKLQGTKIVFGKPSQVGRTLNTSKTTTAIVNALRNRALGTLGVTEPIPPVLALVDPTLTTEQAKADVPLMKPISSWTTFYQSAAHNGFGANIRIPTTTINGYEVAPQETFSFWKAVGPVTKELGYKDGGAIIDGHTEPQGAIGGGICSCSTTLFNAALRGGFQMGDRLNHYYYLNRYPLGLDATVFISASGQAQDMTWTNDTDYPVVIQGINAAGSVKFVLYSVPNGRTTTFTKPIVKNYTKATTVTQVDKSIPRGTTQQTEYATDGEDVWVTRQVTDKTGAVIHKETYYSHYATVTGVILTNP